jgi:hypothetical protein
MKVNCIEDIRVQDEFIFNIFKRNFPIVKEHLTKTKYPKTLLAMIILDTGANCLKCSIFDVAENTDLYGAKVLFRSLIEHFLRFNFLYLTCAKEKSDQAGEEYLTFCNAKDELDLAKAYKTVNAMWSSTPNNETWENILKGLQNPLYKNYSKQFIENKVKKYTYKNLIKSINLMINYDTKDIDPGLLGSIIIAYSELSSFVHGSQFAFRKMEEVITNNTLDSELVEICKMTFMLSSIIKMFSYSLFLNEDSRLTTAFKEIQDLINAFSKE